MYARLDLIDEFQKLPLMISLSEKCSQSCICSVLCSARWKLLMYTHLLITSARNLHLCFLQHIKVNIAIKKVAQAAVKVMETTITITFHATASSPKMNSKNISVSFLRQCMIKQTYLHAMSHRQERGSSSHLLHTLLSFVPLG